MRWSMVLLALLVATSVAGSVQTGRDSGIGRWSEVAEVRRRDLLAVSYRARLEGDRLLVEARHEPGWHSYAMDNVERARARSDREDPETEMPTRIEIEGGVRRNGPWSQSPPQELSRPELRWYTWGFSETIYFAAPVARVDGSPVAVRINGQACTESRCLWIDDLVLAVPTVRSAAGEADAEVVDLGTLVPVATTGKGGETP